MTTAIQSPIQDIHPPTFSVPLPYTPEANFIRRPDSHPRPEPPLSPAAESSEPPHHDEPPAPLASRFLHPSILPRLIAHVNHPANLVALLKTCKALYHVAGSKLYQRLNIDYEAQRPVLVDYGRPNPLFAHVQWLTIDGHDLEDCAVSTAGLTPPQPCDSCEVGDGECDGMCTMDVSSPFPAMHTLAIRPRQDVTCTGSHCSLLAPLRPLTVAIGQPQYLNLSRHLLSQAAKIHVPLGPDGARLLPRALTLPLGPNTELARYIFALSDSCAPGSPARKRELERFRRACSMIVQMIGGEQNPNACPNCTCPNCTNDTTNDTATQNTSSSIITSTNHAVNKELIDLHIQIKIERHAGPRSPAKKSTDAHAVFKEEFEKFVAIWEDTTKVMSKQQRDRVTIIRVKEQESSHHVSPERSKSNRGSQRSKSEEGHSTGESCGSHTKVASPEQIAGSLKRVSGSVVPPSRSVSTGSHILADTPTKASATTAAPLSTQTRKVFSDSATADKPRSGLFSAVSRALSSSHPAKAFDPPVRAVAPAPVKTAEPAPVKAGDYARVKPTDPPPTSFVTPFPTSKEPQTPSRDHDRRNSTSAVPQASRGSGILNHPSTPNQGPRSQRSTPQLAYDAAHQKPPPNVRYSNPVSGLPSVQSSPGMRAPDLLSNGGVHYPSPAQSSVMRGSNRLSNDSSSLHLSPGQSPATRAVDRLTNGGTHYPSPSSRPSSRQSPHHGSDSGTSSRTKSTGSGERRNSNHNMQPSSVPKASEWLSTFHSVPPANRPANVVRPPVSWGGQAARTLSPRVSLEALAAQEEAAAIQAARARALEKLTRTHPSPTPSRRPSYQNMNMPRSQSRESSGRGSKRERIVA